MPFLDVGEAFLALEFVTRFDVLRRYETINNYGRSKQSAEYFNNVAGTVYPYGDNSLVTDSDKRYGVKTIQVVTRFRFQLRNPRLQPDVVVWTDTSFIVEDLQDYSQFGGGMLVATATFIDLSGQVYAYKPPPSPAAPPGAYDIISGGGIPISGGGIVLTP